MPTVFVWKGYRFFVYSNERDEPPHIHIRSAEREAKVWLDDLRVARARGFSDHEIGVILRHTSAYRQRLLVAWYESPWPLKPQLI